MYKKTASQELIPTNTNRDGLNKEIMNKIDNMSATEQQISKVVVVQPTVPSYRIGFFSRLFDVLGDSFSVYASVQDMGVLTKSSAIPVWKHQLGSIRDIAPGLQWQSGVMRIPMVRGDIFVISGAPRCISNIALLIKARVKGVTTIWWGHYMSSTSKSWRAKLRLFIARLASAQLFYTDREVNEYRKRVGGRRKELLFALNNGLNNEDIVRLRTPYELQKRGRRLLFIGRVTKKANLPLLLRALAVPECCDIKLDVVGDGGERGFAQTLTATLGVEARVVWHGPSINEETIALISNRCSLFVYPGSVGLSLIHGLCYGLPAIVHDDRWEHMPEIAAFENRKNGMSFRKGNVSSLARTISAALEDGERLKVMSDEAIATTDKSFNVDDMVRRFLETIETLCNQKRSKSALEKEECLP